MSLRRLYNDNCLHDQFCLELLFQIVGADRYVFGTEKPGSGSAVDSVTGHDMDELRPFIESIGTLSDGDKRAVLGKTAKSVYRLDGNRQTEGKLCP